MELFELSFDVPEKQSRAKPFLTLFERLMILGIRVLVIGPYMKVNCMVTVIPLNDENANMIIREGGTGVF